MRPFSTFSERFNAVIRIVIAYGLIALLFVLNVVSVPYPLAGIAKAPLVLMALYYWSIYRPTLFPAWMAFVAGCLMDIITGAPIGLNALTFVVLQWVISDQRRFLAAQNFFVIWVVFGLLAAGIKVTQWGIMGLASMTWPPLGPALITVALGVCLFPLVCVMLHITHKLLPSPPPLNTMKGKT